MSKAEATLGLIRLLAVGEQGNEILKNSHYWENLEADVIEHLPEDAAMAEVIVREFNALAIAAGVPNRISLEAATFSPDPSWNREIAHQAGMGGLSATDYLGED